MAKHIYIDDNLFDEEDESETDNSTSINNYRTGMLTPQTKPPSNSYNGQEQQKQLILQKQREIEQRTLESAARSISLLRDSEDIGTCAAQELAQQGEQLQKTNQKLDEINASLKKSQKHINGIKSVFHGLKNYVSGKSDKLHLKNKSSSKLPGPSNKCYNTVDDSSLRTKDNFNSHPVTRLQGLDGQSSKSANSKNVNDVLDDNLNEMAHHIVQLKGLGVEFGNQIDHQNELIEILQNKVEVADIKIDKQNKQMNKLLGK